MLPARLHVDENFLRNLQVILRTDIQSSIESLKAKLFFSLCLSFLLLSALPAQASTGVVRIGFLAWMGEAVAAAQWQPLMVALQQALPRHRLVAHYLDLSGMDAAIARQGLEFVVTNPGHYVALEAGAGVTRIATQMIEPGQDSAHAVGSAVIALTGRYDLHQLEDLQGKKLAAVTPQAFGGYQVVWAELKRRGLDPEHGDVIPVFTGYPMSQVITAVDKGEADAGVIRSCLLEQLIRQGQLSPTRFRVLSPQGGSPLCLSSSPVYPGWAFAAAPHTPVNLSREVLIALLSLSPAQTGQTWGVPADYHPVHEMLRELQITPYAFLRDHRFSALVRRYWPLAATALALLILWLVYTLRVEVLVQRRTRELSEALNARHQLEESVNAQQQQMEHLSRLSILGELSGTLAHELNQPLATIGNYARSLTRRLVRGNLSEAATAQAAEEIASAAERAAAILAGIRDFARKRVRVRQRCAVAGVVQEAVTLFRGMVARAPEVRISDQLPPDRGQVEIDPLQIQQVMLNLLKNALDAHRGNGVPDAVIGVYLQVQADNLCISIIDHGGGLNEGDLSRLFEPFFTTKPDGLGLGLSICKTIVEAHGGDMYAEAVPDGLNVRFTLPPATDEHDSCTA